jgi:membrane-associated phospholipid phosphatase
MTAAAGTSVFMSLFFLLVYGGCNWITSKRLDVGTWYFEWERLIPFVPLMILPYMSIDLFFVAAPFLCRDREEQVTLRRRIVFAILVAGAFFLAMPLHFAFERPQATGWLGAVFDIFRGFDQPYNLFPSLHITLRTILASLYARHTRGPVRLALNVWFSLIGFSTVLTYQHHVVDVAGGFVLAAVCFYLFPEGVVASRGVRNLHVFTYYAAASALCLALALIAWPWGGLLLWPALSLAITAAGYAGFGAGIFRKTNGRLPLSARLLLAPMLLGHRLSLLYYRRQCRPWDQVTPGLLIGKQLNDAEAGEAVGQGVTAVLDLTAEFSEARPFLAITYRSLPILDLTAPTREQLRQAADFIAQHAARGTVYVHCKVGYSRSAAVVGAYLLSSGHAATAEEAVALVRKARPTTVVRPEAWEALEQDAHLSLLDHVDHLPSRSPLAATSHCRNESSVNRSR